ncbi:dihydrodipicolinate synthase family protein [Tuwongella immobilis]|uniref:N-acetylneuraminate lyase n=1 Tax=Tuwongella immobilis TaxID=692036 RepID=A0A6C2YSZ0_9BACT|nr:dihydrodipicolinate synthase family protein [Tuwongella immobilis]VIP04447.1 n-acetylneuraminate lyase : Dihydrodipicolinate synthase/N-acetylneuraminate lyase OS=Singulisphaera acidiphila (strain ATCC BAA-1392 / DSM 18658 / VKM B-2454 / MOB10) GN=Sinac_2107 PE=3 SV=1: DHDPS [Tuwongella immobilis]VTS06256.1 n-acetylneuraminate lyase : Dihydrodipicolinate synthase/N-acetylneuraminate lyase OS=Singulisphaera acidiphila (strain ATCC BAA-1392 / DSM 18658 / VKM B-2454 / MOB10) GN=Sinac_2107 PE=3 SV
MTLKLTGLVPATHTPFTDSGEVNLAVIETQAEHLLRDGIRAVFIAGTTGESHSLTLAERLAITERWLAVTRGTPMQVIVHVGGNSLGDAKTLAAHAQTTGAAAIAALAPSYFKPKSVADLLLWTTPIAAAAPAIPFYFYDIPPLTGVNLPMPDYLEQAAERIPNLAGVKFSNPDLLAYQRCLHLSGGRLDMPWGIDEYLLSALAVGGSGGVGSSYNFAAPLFHRLLAAFGQGDWATARAEQWKAAQWIETLIRFGYMPSARRIMERLGVPVGAPRLPFQSLSADQAKGLDAALEQLGVWSWR